MRKIFTHKKIREIRLLVIGMLGLCLAEHRAMGQCTITGLVMESQTTDSANFRWNALPLSYGYTYYVSPIPKVDSNNLQTINDPGQDSVNLIGLCGGTTYYLFVSPICDDPSSQTWDTIKFVKQCTVLASSLVESGLGVYCNDCTVNIGLPVYELSQTYTWNQTGKPVHTDQGDPTSGNGGSLSFQFNITSSSQDGIYTISTKPTCGVCTGSGSVNFGYFPVYLDSVGGIKTTQVTDSSVSFQWSPVVAGETYQYGVVSSPDYGSPDQPVTTQNLYGTVKNLSPGTTYYIAISAMCDNGGIDQDFSNWYYIPFTTLPANHVCNVIQGTLTGAGNYCPGNTVKLTVPVSQVNQSYSFLRNGVPLDTLVGNGASLSYSFLMGSASLAGTYTVLTNDTCNCCTAVSFGNAVVSYDSLTGLTKDAVTANSASFHWNALGAGINYQYGISTSNTQPPAAGALTTVTTASGSELGLSAGTLYYIYVRAQCDNGSGGTGYGNWDTLSFTTTAAAHVCNVQPGTLTGGGIYCLNSPGNLTIPQSQKGQSYSILLNGQSVFTAAGTGGDLVYSFTMSANMAGTYTAMTNDTCNCCTAVSFGNAVISYDAITGLTKDALTQNSVSFHWNSMAAGATYRYGVSSSPTQAPPFTSTTTTSETVTGLSAGTTYYIYVSGQCDNGTGATGFGDPAILSFTTAAATTQPCNVQAGTLTGAGIYCAGSTVTIGIPVTVGSQSYSILQNGKAVFTGAGHTDGSALVYSFIISAADQAGTYTAVTNDTCSCCSPVNFGNVSVVFNAISGLTKDAATQNSVSFHWNSLASGTTYQYGVSPSATQPPSYTSTTATNATVPALSAGTTYYIYVRGQCDNGVGGTAFGDPVILSFATADATTTQPCNVQAGTLTGGGIYCPGSTVVIGIPATLPNQSYSILQNGQTLASGPGQADGSGIAYSFVLSSAAQAGTFTAVTNDTCVCCTPVSFGSVAVSYDTVGGLTVDKTTQNAVNFHWSNLVPGASYQYGVSGNATQAPLQMTTTTGTSGSKSGLQPHTNYYIYVTAGCDNGTGAVVGSVTANIVSFTTLADTSATTPPVGPGNTCDSVSPPVAKLFGSQLGSSALSGNQWFFNGIAIAGATNDSYTPNYPGIYAVQVTANGCVLKSAPVTVNSSDLLSPNVQIYPNPVSTQITIHNLGINSVTVQLFDLMGRQITGVSGIRGTYIMGSGSLEKGSYVIKVTDEKTNHKMTRLIVKM